MPGIWRNRAGMTETRRITTNLPLGPGELFAPRRGFKQSLGWAPAGLRYYYLARNAIWHGVGSLGLKPGETILMPSYNQGVELEVLLRRGFTLRYYRVDEQMRIDLGHLREQLGPEISAVYVIHYLGFPQPIEALQALCREHGVKLIEDCALALFSRAPGGPLGSFGDMSLFCLYKSLPVPHGGVLAVNLPGVTLPPRAHPPDWKSTTAFLAHGVLDGIELNWKAWGIRRLVPLARAAARRVKRAAAVDVMPIYATVFEPEMVDVGMSAVARHILDRTDASRVIARRRDNYERLSRNLGGAVRPFHAELPAGVCPLSFPILVRDQARAHDGLAAAGLETTTRWPRSHPDIPEGKFPETDFLRKQVLEIPIHQGLGADHIDCIARLVNEFARW
jgi:dTDP-4-amino-4,6-dideoxygalactose transaminase